MLLVRVFLLFLAKVYDNYRWCLQLRPCSTQLRQCCWLNANCRKNSPLSFNLKMKQLLNVLSVVCWRGLKMYLVSCNLLRKDIVNMSSLVQKNIIGHVIWNHKHSRNMSIMLTNRINLSAVRFYCFKFVNRNPIRSDCHTTFPIRSDPTAEQLF